MVELDLQHIYPLLLPPSLFLLPRNLVYNNFRLPSVWSDKEKLLMREITDHLAHYARSLTSSSTYILCHLEQADD